MDYRQVERRVPLLLPDRRTYVDTLVLDIEGDALDGIVIGSHLDAMRPRTGSIAHFAFHGVIPVASKPVDYGADHEVSAKLPGEAVKFVNVAFPITNVNTPLRLPQKIDGLAQIVEPSDALLRLDRNPGLIDLSLELGRALELVAVPELDCAQPKRQPFLRHYKAGMHQYSAYCMVPKPALLVTPTVDAFRKANLVRVAALICELRRILKQQDRPMRHSISCLHSCKMAGQYVAFLNLGVGKEPVCGLGVRPVLTGQRDRPAHSVAQAAQQIATSPSKPSVLEGRLIDLTERPMVTLHPDLVAVSRHSAPHEYVTVLVNESQLTHPIQVFSFSADKRFNYLWVIASPAGWIRR